MSTRVGVQREVGPTADKIFERPASQSLYSAVACGRRTRIYDSRDPSANCNGESFVRRIGSGPFTTNTRVRRRAIAAQKPRNMRKRLLLRAPYVVRGGGGGDDRQACDDRAAYVHGVLGYRRASEIRFRVSSTQTKRRIATYMHTYIYYKNIVHKKNHAINNDEPAGWAKLHNDRAKRVQIINIARLLVRITVFGARDRRRILLRRTLPSSSMRCAFGGHLSRRAIGSPDS